MSDNNKPPQFNWKKPLLLGVAFFLAARMLMPADDAAPAEDGRPRVTQNAGEVEWSMFVDLTRDRRMASILHQGDMVFGQTTDGKSMRAYVPKGADAEERLRDYGATYRYVPPPPPKEPSFLLQALISFGPMLLLIGVWVYFMRQMQGGGKGGPMGQFTQNKAKREIPKTKFRDVAGIDEAKQDLEEIVDFLKNPKEYTRLGGHPPKGVLMVGPPGTGKTLTAKAVAGEANVPFFSISGSDFVEMFVGVGASRVRSLFEEAKKSAPSIIFIDEIDAVGKKRGSGGPMGGNDEREQTLNQLLVEMDGFADDTGVIVIAATNREDVLDDALLRPGRFDRKVHVTLPDVRGREQILGVHVKKIKSISDDVDLSKLARGTPGWSGASLENLVNEAIAKARRKKKAFVSMEDFEQAKDKILMGDERPSLHMSDEEKAMTAYHEAGHAVLGHALYPKTDPVYKVSIIPRGRALGVTVSLPERDTVSYTKDKLEAMMAMLLAGRKAEQITFGENKQTTGASNDIERTTAIAKQMVMEWGMSPLGPRKFSTSQQESYFGGSTRDTSQDVSSEIDRYINQYIDEADKLAEKVLTEHAAAYERVAKGLIKFEVLDEQEFRLLMDGDAMDEIAAKRAANAAANAPKGSDGGEPPANDSAPPEPPKAQKFAPR